MPLRFLTRLVPLCLATLPLWGASNTFIPQGPAPSNNSFDKTADSGSPEPIATHPTDPNTLFLGGVNGGVWRTNDFGITWTPLTDHKRSLSIGSLAFDLTNSNTVVAGTGISSNGALGNFNEPDPQERGGRRIGLLYSTDSGNTWSEFNGNAAFTNISVMDVIPNGITPNVSGTILAGTFEPAKPKSTAAGYGLYTSSNGGNTFTLQASGGVNQLGTGPVTSLAFDPASPTTIFAAVTNPNGANLNQTALYKSTNGGSTWAKVFSSTNTGLINSAQQTVLDVVTGPGGSVAVSVIQQNITDPNIDFQVQGVFLSTNDGASWTSLPMPAVNVNPEGQGVINSHIAIDPTNNNIVYLTGTFVGGVPFPLAAYVLQPATTPVSFSAGIDGSLSHADSRFITFDASGRMLVGSDGGLDVRTNPSGNGVWTSIVNGLSLWQSYGSAYDANNNLLLTSGQDTGFTVQPNPGNTVWNTFSASGDGFNAVINDQGGTSYYYSTIQNLLRLNRVVNGDTTTKVNLTLSPDISADTSFVSPFVLNRVDMTKIAIGTKNHVYLTQDNLVSSTLTLTDFGTPGAGQVNEIAYGAVNNINALLIGTESTPFVFFSPSATPGTLVGQGSYGGGRPSFVLFDGQTDARCYITDSNSLFQGSGLSGSTYSTFSNITANLTPLNIVNPMGLEFLSNNGVNSLFVGGLNFPGVGGTVNSPLAVADSTAGTLSGWRYFGGATLPNTMVNNISYNNKSDTLLVSAYGRGNWLMYDVTSNFATATQLWFGKANNDSTPDVGVLTNGTSISRPLMKFGPGTLTITGAATYTGLTTVLGGTLALQNGSSLIPGNAIFDSGTTLKGVGTIAGNVNMLSGSTISPGNSIGTMTVGSLTLNPGSTTNIEIDPIASSEIHVTGTATLAGTLNVTQDPGTYPPTNLYDILVVDGGYTGAFDPGITGGLPGFRFSLLYLPNLVQLTYSRFLSTNGLNSNNLTLVNFLNNFANTSQAFNTLFTLSANDLEGALEAVDPARNAIPRFVIDDTMFAFSDMLNDHFAFRHLSHILQNRCYCQTECADECGCGGFWIDGYADFVKQEAWAETPGFRFNSEGVFLGYDQNYSKDTVVGATLGYNHSHYRVNNHFGNGNINSFVIAPYGLTYCGDFYIDAALTYAYSRIKNERNIVFTGFDGEAESSHHSNQLMPHLGFGYDCNTNYCGVIEPFAEFDWVFNWDEDFREFGSDAFDFRQKHNASWILRSKVGLNMYQTWDYGCNDCDTFVLEETFAYVNKTLNNVGKVKATLPGNSHFFTVKILKKDLNLFNFGINALYKGINGFYGSLTYDGEFGHNYVANEVQFQIGKLF